MLVHKPWQCREVLQTRFQIAFRTIAEGEGDAVAPEEEEGLVVAEEWGLETSAITQAPPTLRVDMSRTGMARERGDTAEATGAEEASMVDL